MDNQMKTAVETTDFDKQVGGLDSSMSPSREEILTPDEADAIVQDFDASYTGELGSDEYDQKRVKTLQSYANVKGLSTVQNMLNNPTLLDEITNKRNPKLRTIAASIMAAMSSLTPSASSIGTAATAGGLATATISCDKATVEPTVIDNKPTEAQLEAWHQEAEAYATAQGWSQGVRSLVAGMIDYHYYKESANGPILIRLSYQVDVDDFINKIETDAANRGTYDPKTGGILYARASSLEGDGKQNFWNIPTKVIYNAKEQGKSNVIFQIGDYPAENPIGNTIGKTEGLIPNKQMQIYTSYGNANWVNPDEIVVQPSKKGALKDIL